MHGLPDAARRQLLTETLASLIVSAGPAPLLAPPAIPGAAIPGRGTRAAAIAPSGPVEGAGAAVSPPRCGPRGGAPDGVAGAGLGPPGASASSTGWRHAARAFRNGQGLAPVARVADLSVLDVTAVYLGMGLLMNPVAEAATSGAGGLDAGDLAWLLALQVVARGEALEALLPLTTPPVRERLPAAHALVTSLPLTVTELLDLPPAHGTGKPAPVLALPGDARRILASGGAGLGLLLGAALGLLLSWWGAPVWAPAVLGLLSGALLGSVLGRRVSLPTCSSPGCHTVIPPLARACRACGGEIIGRAAPIPQHTIKEPPSYQRAAGFTPKTSPHRSIPHQAPFLHRRGPRR